MSNSRIHDAVPLWPNASLDELFELASRRYELEFEPVSAGGVTLEIVQIANMRELLDKAIADGALEDAVHTLPLWAKIWPASLILGHVLRHMKPEGRSFLEIGAGCGVTGLVAAALGFRRVVISDINDDALLFARINVLKNGLQDVVDVMRVDIREHGPDERFSLIVGSEILYLEPLYRPLVKFLKRRLLPFGSMPEPEVLLATDHRRNARPFFKKAAKEFSLSQKQIGAKATGGESDETPERHLLVLHRMTPLR